MKKVVVTTDEKRRGVFFGELVNGSIESGLVTLKDARMCIKWPVENHGVLGLAADGPKEGARISPKIPQLQLNGVTAIMDCIQEAVTEWEKEPWN